MFEFTRQNISLQVLFERRLFHSPLQLVINLQVWRQFLHFTLQLQHKVNNKSLKTEPYTDKTVTDLPFLTLRTFSAASNVSFSSAFSCLCLFCSSATKNTNSDWWCLMKHKTWELHTNKIHLFTFNWTWLHRATPGEGRCFSASPNLKLHLQLFLL